MPRTFHPDEANQAFTTGRLLETGSFVYNPADHHGPTLYYAAAALQKAGGHATTADLSPSLLRATPLVFAVLALVLGAVAVRRVTRGILPAIAFVLLLGAAPVFVFFATDFIQEMLLAAFLIGAFFAAVSYHTSTSPKRGRHLFFFGLFAGLALATKETAVLSFAAAALAALPFLLRRRHALSVPGSVTDPAATPAVATRPIRFVLPALVAMLTALVFYSSFGAHWQGVYDAFVAAPAAMFARATGAAATANWHVHPWWRYLEWLFFGSLVQDAPAHWSATFPMTLLPALFVSLFLPFGLFAAMRRIGSALLRTTFLAAVLYTTLLLTFYSALPYKTPWCALQIFVGFAFAAVFGCTLARDAVAALAARRRHAAAPARTHRLLSAVFLLVLPGAIVLADYLPNLSILFREPDSKKIPYNYAAASPQVRTLANDIANVLLAAKPSDWVAVLLPAEDTWPLPFYLRACASVGYWHEPEADLQRLAKMPAARRPAALVVPAEIGHLVFPFFPELKQTKRYEMRPGVRVRLFR